MSVRGRIALGLQGIKSGLDIQVKAIAQMLGGHDTHPNPGHDLDRAGIGGVGVLGAETEINHTVQLCCLENNIGKQDGVPISPYFSKTSAIELNEMASAWYREDAERTLRLMRRYYGIV